MNRFQTLILSVLVASLVGCSMPVSSHTTATATVVKVYSVTDVAGHAFIAYVVNHNGVEVVISDSLVVIGALSRGRSSSRGLLRGCRRAAALLLSTGKGCGGGAKRPG